MGAEIEVGDEAAAAGEPTATLTARSSQLRATEIEPEEVSALVDEIPILAVAAACAEGSSAFRGLGELRLKETDRLEAVATQLRLMGMTIAVEGDDLLITGRRAPARCAGVLPRRPPDGHDPGGGGVAGFGRKRDRRSGGGIGLLPGVLRGFGPAGRRLG